jgi:lysophospholipase L1-like esterase
MRRAGNECALHVYPTGGHGFGFRPSYKFHDQMLSDLATWLKSRKAPRQDAIRVACIGNSITEGMGIDMASQQGYPAQLQQLLGDGYNVRNYGVSARTLLNNGDIPYMREMAWRDAQAFRPDIVIIKLGTNDSKDYNWRAHGGEFEADLQAMIDTLKPMVPVQDKKGRPTKKNMRAAKPAIYLCTPIPPFEDKWGITDSVIVNGVIPAVRNVAQRNNLPVIDLYHVVTNAADMTGDKIHPNAKGARRMAEHIAEVLKK